MKRKNLTRCGALALTATVFFLYGCGGGASNAPTAAESVAAAVTKGSSTVVADKISVLDSTQTKSSGKVVGALISAFPATADWNKDKTNTYVHDKSTEVFTNVNEIL